MIQIPFSEQQAKGIMLNESFGRIITRDGFPVRILAWNLKGSYPVAGVVDLGDAEYCRQWTLEGKVDYRRNVTSNCDLVIETEGGEDV